MCSERMNGSSHWLDHVYWTFDIASAFFLVWVFTDVLKMSTEIIKYEKFAYTSILR